MASSFDQLKKNRSSSLTKLTEQLSKINSKGQSNQQDDNTYWKPTRGADGNGFAVIRFLPAPEGEEYPFVRIFDHGFQGPTGQWYIEKSRTTIDPSEADPVAEINRILWNSGNDADKEIARKQKRRLSYVSNILVIKDAGNPENEGKVFRYKYGKKIFDKLNDLMNPQFEDEDPINPFDLWEGANFKLKIRMFEGYPNYDKSEFESKSPLSNDDDEMEKIWKQCHPLQDLLDPKHFKSYEELKAKLDRVLGKTMDTSSASKSSSSAPDEEEDDELSMPKQRQKEAAPKQQKEAPPPSSDDDDDDDLAFFRDLANK